MSGPHGPSRPGPEVWHPGPPSPSRNRLPLVVGGLAVLVVGGLVMLALAASGDDGAGTGNAGASDDPGGASTRPEGMTIPTAPGGGMSSETTDPAAEVSPLGGVDPCSMLSDDQVAGLGSGAGAPEPDEVGRARTCGWRVRNATGDLGTDDARATRTATSAASPSGSPR